MAGRKEDPVWQRFNKEKNKNRPGYKATCKVCDKTLEGIVIRMKQHVQKCRSSDISILSPDDEGIDKEMNVNQDTQEGTTAVATQKVPSVISKSKAKPIIQNNINSYLVKTSAAQKEAIDLQIAKYIYATNSSFRSVDHAEFKQMISSLRPGYNPPSRNNVAGILLDKVYENIKSEILAQLQNNIICLAIDGWSNVHNDPIVCVTAIFEGRGFLIDTVDTSGHSHTAEYLMDLVRNSIKRCQENFHCRVASFVTDNASNMTKMRSDLIAWQKESYCKESRDGSTPQVDFLAYGCGAHILNLLAHDLDMPEVRAHVVAIVKYFRNTHLPAAKYKEAGGKKLILPIDVRWNSTADCLETYMKNWSILLNICEENRNSIDNDISNKVKNFALKRSVENYLLLLKPIAVALDELQRDSCLISDACEIFAHLEDRIKKNPHMNRAMFKKFLLRKEMALTPAHYLANILDPRYFGKDLSEDDKNSGMQYLFDHYPTVVPTVIKYRAQTKPFATYMFSETSLENLSPLAWWLSYQGMITPQMIELLRQLFSACASSAPVERVFSTFGYIQSDTRNRLGNEKAGKLVTIFKTLNPPGSGNITKKQHAKKRKLESVQSNEGDSTDSESNTEIELEAGSGTSVSESD